MERANSQTAKSQSLQSDSGVSPAQRQSPQSAQQTLGNLMVQGLLQPKLAVSQPGDPYEQQADSVANRITKTTLDGQHPLISPISALHVQRLCAGCEEQGPQPCCEPELIQPKSRDGAGADSQDSNRPSKLDLAPLQSGGHKLPPFTQRRFETRLGRPLDHVRLHTDAHAAVATGAINAKAFTLSNHIAFAPGQYAPHSESGQWLLAHELTHVLQQAGQGNLMIQRWNDSPMTDRIIAEQGRAMYERSERQRRLRERWTRSHREGFHRALDQQGTSLAEDIAASRSSLMRQRVAMFQQVVANQGTEDARDLTQFSTIFQRQPHLPADLMPNWARAELAKATLQTAIEANEVSSETGEATRSAFNVFFQSLLQVAQAQERYEASLRRDYARLQADLNDPRNRSVSCPGSCHAPAPRRFPGTFPTFPSTPPGANAGEFVDNNAVFDANPRGWLDSHTESIVIKVRVAQYLLRDANTVGQWQRVLREYGETTGVLDRLLIQRLPRTSEMVQAFEYARDLLSRQETFQRNYPDAVKIPAVFYPEDQFVEVQTEAGGTERHEVARGIPWMFYLTHTENPSDDRWAENFEWVLHDLTSAGRPSVRLRPGNVLKAVSTPRTFVDPPSELFAQLNHKLKFPKGYLYWTAPSGQRWSMPTTEPWTLSDWLTAIGVSLAVLGIILGTAGYGTPAAVALVASAGFSIGATLANLADLREHNLLTQRDIDRAALSIALDVISALTLGLGRVVTLSVQTGARAAAVTTEGAALAARTATLASRAGRLWFISQSVATATEAVNLYVAAHDFIQQARMIQGQQGLTQAQRNEAIARLVLTALITGGLMIMSLRSGIKDLNRGTPIHIDVDPHTGTTRLRPDVPEQLPSGGRRAAAGEAAEAAEVIEGATPRGLQPGARGNIQLEGGTSTLRNAAGETHQFGLWRDGRITRCSDFCTDLTDSVLDRMRTMRERVPHNSAHIEALRQTAAEAQALRREARAAAADAGTLAGRRQQLINRARDLEMRASLLEEQINRELSAFHSTAPRDWPVRQVDYDTLPRDLAGNIDTLPHGVVYEFPGGHRVWRLRGGGIAHESYVGPAHGRQHFEKEFYRPGEAGRPGYHRAHTLGQGTGFESPFAIPYAPSKVNLAIQNDGIEEFLRGLRDEAPAGTHFHLRTETHMRPGSLDLESITYRVDVSQGGRRADFFEFDIQVSGPRNNPNITYSVPTVTANPDLEALFHMVDVPARVQARWARTRARARTGGGGGGGTVRRMRANGADSGARLAAFSRCTGLAVGQAHDHHERQADAVADGIGRAPVRYRTQWQQAPSAGEPAPIAARSAGTALPGQLRRRLEFSLSTDLTQVRVHDDAVSRRTAAYLNAKALTVANHIYLGANESTADERLMAHEATHVAQWQAGRTGLASAARPSRAHRHDPLEAEAQTGRMSGMRSPAQVFAWDNPNDEVQRPGPQQLAAALGRVDLFGIPVTVQELSDVTEALDILRINHNAGLMRRLRDEYGNTFFRDLNLYFSAQGLWGQALPYVEEVLTLAEQITAHTNVTADEEGIYRLLQRVPPATARAVMEQAGSRTRGHGEESWGTVEEALRAALDGWFDNPNEYERAVAILLDRAGMAPSNAGPEGDEALSIARSDAAFRRMRNAFEQYSIMGPDPHPSGALLAAAELTQPERARLLPRVERQMNWAVYHINGWEVLRNVLRTQSDAEAMALAMSASIRIDRESADPLGMERVTSRASDMLQAAQTEEDLERLQDSLHDTTLLSRISSLPNWRETMRSLGVSEQVRIAFEFRTASLNDVSALIDHLAAYPPAAVARAVVENPSLLNYVSRETSAAQQEALDVLLGRRRGGEAAEPAAGEAPADQATAAAQLAAWQMLRAYEQDSRPRLFAVLRQLPEEERSTLPHSQSYQELRRRMRGASLADQALFGRLERVISGEETLASVAWSFGHEINVYDPFDVGEVGDTGVFAEALAERYHGRQDQMRQAMVDFFNIPRDQWNSLPDERLAALQDYALRRELIDRSPDATRTLLYDTMMGEPQLTENAERPLDPGREADYMWYRLRDRADVRASIETPNDWTRMGLDEATLRFKLRYDELRLVGIRQEDLAELYLLYRAAMQLTTEHREASDSAALTVASIVGAAVGVAVVTVLSGGTLGPVAVAALAGTLGGSAAAAAGAAVRAESTEVTVIRDFGSGFIEGALGAALEPLAAGSSLVRGAGGVSARVAGEMGASAATRAGVSRVASAAVRTVIEGSVGGAASELYLTATDQATWNGSMREVLARLIMAVARGAAFGAGGGLLGAGVIGGLGAAWGRMAGRHGQRAVREVMEAFDNIALGSVENLSRYTDEQVEAIFRARQLALAGDAEGATSLLTGMDIVPEGRAGELVEAMRARRAMAERAAAELHTPIDSPRLAEELGLRDVIIDPDLPPAAAEIHYGVGLEGLHTLQLRVGRAANMGDLIIHGETVRALRAWSRETRSARGMLERVRAWLRGGTLSNQEEVVLELQKHARMIEARERALSGLSQGDAAAARLDDEIAALRHAAEDIELRLRGFGVPEGVIGGWRDRLPYESESQATMEALLDATGTFHRLRHSRSGNLIREPGFSGGQSLDRGRRGAYYSRQLSESTFPDIYGHDVTLGADVAMEIKTPGEFDTVYSYFNQPHIRDHVLNQHGGRELHLPRQNILDPTGRAAALPPGGVPHNYLVVDLRFCRQSIPEALNDLSQVLRSYRGVGPGGDARHIWDGVRFLTGPMGVGRQTRTLATLSPVMQIP